MAREAIPAADPATSIACRKSLCVFEEVDEDEQSLRGKTRDRNVLVQAAKAQGWQVSIVAYIPFSQDVKPEARAATPQGLDTGHVNLG